MPSKNTIKTYLANGYYHVYNRGVEKRQIFHNQRDYDRFTYYFGHYLNHSNIPSSGQLFGRIELIAYCLMPNHFHLLIKQNDEAAMTEFMRRISTGYTMYYNLVNTRVGSLFQGTYKAVLIETSEQLLQVSSYIHRNPGKDFAESNISSFKYYMNQNMAPEWLSTRAIFESVQDPLTYSSFVSEQLKKIS